jgi:hypothetical protein
MFSVDRRWEYATENSRCRRVVHCLHSGSKPGGLLLDVRATRSADQASLQFTGTFPILAGELWGTCATTTREPQHAEGPLLAEADITSASDARLTRCLRMSGWCKCSFSTRGPQSLPGDCRENPSSMQPQLRLPHGCSACDHYYRVASPARPNDIQHRLRLHQLDLRHGVAEFLLSLNRRDRPACSGIFDQRAKHADLLNIFRLLDGRFDRKSRRNLLH